MRIVFMGSPEFALPTLRRLIDSDHEVVAVFTQPDRPTGRGRKLAAPPVKTLALEHGLPVHQPKSISKAEVVNEIRALRPDLGIIAAYGQILRQRVLDAFPLGVLNVHASLLPRWRGAAPITAAVLAGDAETGATIMRVELALDAGPMLAAARVPIAPDDTTGTLTPKIAEAGASLLMEVLPRCHAGTIEAVPQDDTLASYAPQIEKSDGLIQWDRDDAGTIARQVRAYNPWPAAFTYLDGAPLRILRAVEHSTLNMEPGYGSGELLRQRITALPGTINVFTGAHEMPTYGAGFVVKASRGEVGVIELQPPGGRPMLAAAYLHGHRDIIGKRLVAGMETTNA